MHEEVRPKFVASITVDVYADSDTPDEIVDKVISICDRESYSLSEALWSAMYVDLGADIEKHHIDVEDGF